MDNMFFDSNVMASYHTADGTIEVYGPSTLFKLCYGACSSARTNLSVVHRVDSAEQMCAVLMRHHHLQPLSR